MSHKRFIPIYVLAVAFLILNFLPATKDMGRALATGIMIIAMSSLVFLGDQHAPKNHSIDDIRKRFRRVTADDYFCIAVEYRNYGKYASVLDLNLSTDYQEKFIEQLRTVYGRQQVIAIEHHKVIVIVKFSHTEKHQDERHQRMVAVTNDIARRFSSLLETIPVEDRHFIKMSIGAANQGVKREYQNVYDLIRLAQFTNLIAHEQNRPYIIADEPIRSLKMDIDDFTCSIEESFRLDEFNPFFQPIIDLQEGRIIGCESFVRWQKNSYRVIEAHKFTEIAHAKNLLKDIDIRVIHKTFHVIWELRSKEGLIADDFIIMININATTLDHVSGSEIRELAHRYGLQPSQIEFDIKDGRLTDRALIESISELQVYGFRVAIDIFDSESFALNALLYNSFDTVKIHKSVLSHHDERSGVGPFTEREYQFYQSIVNVAKTMRLKKMLKGVEHRDHLDLARKLQVDFVQGYYFTPPLEQFKFTEYLHKYQEGVEV